MHGRHSTSTPIPISNHVANQRNPYQYISYRTCTMGYELHWTLSIKFVNKMRVLHGMISLMQGKKWKVQMKFAIAYVIGDTKLHDRLCGQHSYRGNVVTMLLKSANTATIPPMIPLIHIHNCNANSGNLKISNSMMTMITIISIIPAKVSSYDNQHIRQFGVWFLQSTQNTPCYTR
jgi:hypothetical protein